jgi:hypothetical protein
LSEEIEKEYMRLPLSNFVLSRVRFRDERERIEEFDPGSD